MQLWATEYFKLAAKKHEHEKLPELHELVVKETGGPKSAIGKASLPVASSLVSLATKGILS